MPIQHFLQLCLLAAIWGSSFMLMLITVPEFGIWGMVELRALLAALILLPIVWARKQLSALRVHYKEIIVVGLFNTAIPFCFFGYGALHLPASLTALLNGTASIFGALLAWLWLREQVTGFAKVGFLCGFVGVFLLSYESLTLDGVSIFPVFACLVATFCYGFAVCYFKKYLPDAKPMPVAAGSQIVSAIVLLPMVFMFPVSTMPSTDAWLAAIILAVFCTGFAYMLYFDLIVKIGAAKAIYVGYMVPVFGLLWGWSLLDERISLYMLSGAGVILFGIALTSGAVEQIYKKHMG